MKTKKPNRKVLVRKLDKLVSQIVVARDKACVLCGSIYQLGCGHLFSRRAYSTRWSLDNVFCQCWPCNYRHVRDQWPFINWYLEKFGKPKLEVLRMKYHSLKKYSDSDLQELYNTLEIENKRENDCENNIERR